MDSQQHSTNHAATISSIAFDPDMNEIADRLAAQPDDRKADLDDDLEQQEINDVAKRKQKESRNVTPARLKQEYRLLVPHLRDTPELLDILANWYQGYSELLERDGGAFLLPQEHYVPVNQALSHKDICHHLRRTIEKGEESYYALAKRSGVNAVVISRFACGERDLRLETAAKLAAALGLTLVPGTKR